MTHPAPRELLIKICRLAWQRGYMAATDGNISLRLEEDRLLMTPSGRSKALIGPEELLLLDMEGNLLEGEGAPSAELGLHLLAYAKRPEAKAVLHAHPPLATALSSAGLELDISALPEALAGLGRVPTVPYASPGALGGDELARAVEPFLTGHHALILGHHGTLTLGPSLESAWALTEKLESAAQVFLAASALGGAQPLPLAEQERLRGLSGVAPEEAEQETPPPLSQRIELVHLPETSEFLVEKRFCDDRGEGHLIVDGLPLSRVAFLTLKKGAGFRGGHVHHRKHEGFYVVSGLASVELVCEKSGERLSLELKPGDRLWMPPKVAHRITALEDLGFVEFTNSSYQPDDDIRFEF